VNGKHRGSDRKFLVPANFGKLSLQEQSAACHIPLSQPGFFFVILLIWALTTAKELLATVELGRHSVWGIHTCEHMDEILDEGQEGFLVSALPLWLKVLIIIMLMIRCVITIGLLWIGSQWLLSTNDFESLVLNAVALEFILCLKEMLFYALMSAKNRQDLANTKFVLEQKKDNMAKLLLAAGFAIPCISVIWVTLYTGYLPWLQLKYTGFQQVLPNYQWDVVDPCKSWMEWRYCLTPPCPENPATGF
jgi:hypothetical protein